jgi:hypothetical protein
MTDTLEVADEWDFYPCRVDDEPASIFLNLWFRERAPIAGLDTLYWVRIAMRDRGDHGMGSGAEAEVLYPIEDQLVARAREHGLVNVGRVRNDGTWQLMLYGPAGRLAALTALANDTRAALDGREVKTGEKRDPEWEVYTEFILPDAERWQWMMDRRVVAVLADNGDVAELPRRVDHWLYFPTARSRDAFVAAAAEDGFAREDSSDDGRYPSGTFGARIYRDDPVELEHIHDVVMQLHDLADEHEGTYDGWETSVERAQA